MDGRQPSVKALSRSLEQQGGTNSKQLQQLRELQTIFQQLRSKVNQRKDECVQAYIKHAASFQDWILLILNRLVSGKILTTDILVFEESLTVSSIIFFPILFNKSTFAIEINVFLC